MSEVGGVVVGSMALPEGVTVVGYPFPVKDRYLARHAGSGRQFRAATWDAALAGLMAQIGGGDGRESDVSGEGVLREVSGVPGGGCGDGAGGMSEERAEFGAASGTARRDGAADDAALGDVAADAGAELVHGVRGDGGEAGVVRQLRLAGGGGEPVAVFLSRAARECGDSEAAVLVTFRKGVISLSACGATHELIALAGAHLTVRSTQP